MTTVAQIREFVQRNPWSTPLEIAKHFQEYDELEERVCIQTGDRGRFYWLQGVDRAFWHTLQEFMRAADVVVKEDALAWAITHTEAWRAFKDSQGRLVTFCPIVMNV